MATLQSAGTPNLGRGPEPMQIGKYEIIRELGKGATSVVYEALDPFVNRHEIGRAHV